MGCLLLHHGPPAGWPPASLPSPSAVDHRGGDLPVFESGAVLLHLAEQDPQPRLQPADKAGRAEVLSWLFWQVVSQQQAEAEMEEAVMTTMRVARHSLTPSDDQWYSSACVTVEQHPCLGPCKHLPWLQGGLGPMTGQADWFLVYAPERSELAISRYVNEVQRLFRWEGGLWMPAWAPGCGCRCLGGSARSVFRSWHMHRIAAGVLQSLKAARCTSQPCTVPLPLPLPRPAA